MPTTNSGFMIQSTHGVRGNFELAVRSLSGFAFAWRNNNPDGGNVWRWSPPSRILATNDPTFPGSDVEILGHMSLIQSAQGPELEALAHVFENPRGGPGEVTPSAMYYLVRYLREGGAWQSEVVWREGPATQVIFGMAEGPALIQGCFGNQRNNYEVVIPAAGGGFAHLYRENGQPGQPWNISGTFFQSTGIDAVTLIQSDYGTESGYPGNLEVVARSGNSLVHYFRDPGGWKGGQVFYMGADGIPGFIQGNYGTTKRNFEIVTPLASGGMQHLYRANDVSNLPWFTSPGGTFGTELGLVDAVALIQSNYDRDSGYPGNLEVVARSRGVLYHWYRDKTGTWITTGPLPPIP